MPPQFQIGQTVRLARGLPYRNAADGDYTIVRPLPDNGGEPQYRIKSDREPHKRVVKEGNLIKVDVAHDEREALRMLAGRPNGNSESIVLDDGTQPARRASRCDPVA